MIRMVWLCLCLGAAVGAARAAPIDAKEQAALQAVVSQQIDAFNRDDGAAAIGFAAPAIKDKFTDAKTFLDMVHNGYAPLLHARRFDFGAATASATGATQAVTIVAADGASWRGLYTFEQIDGAWRITGCLLAKEEGTDI